jgi:hypothetical protein
MSAVFRWSVWGEKDNIVRMLPVSIATFQRAFGLDARYIVCTDEPPEIRPLLDSTVELIPLSGANTPLNIQCAAPWRKWSPIPKLVPDLTEFFIDADVFLVGDPIELRDFIAGTTSHLFLVMREAPGAPHYVGRFRSRVFRAMPPVNTGLVGQRAGVDFSVELNAEFTWWLRNVAQSEQQYHDEQGAVAAVLSRWYVLGRVGLLPQHRYCIVNRRRNSHLTTLDGIAAIHTTMGHAAFDRFSSSIQQYIKNGNVIERSR